MRVLILQRRLPAYRLPFFDRLVAEARSVEIEVVVGIYGGNGDVGRSDMPVKPEWISDWKVFRFAGGVLGLNWRRMMTFDFVVCEHALTELTPWIVGALPGTSLALWGHDRNYQRSESRLVRCVKRYGALRADVWFAYTQGVAEGLKNLGVREGSIVVVHNSSDVVGYRMMLTSVDAGSDRSRYGVRPSESLVVYCGSLIEEKRLYFLFSALDDVCERRSGVRLILAGDGPLRGHVQAMVASRSWAEWVGRVDGLELVKLLYCSDIVVNPGLVGLIATDCFAVGRPLVTTNAVGHSPEAEYLTDRNSVTTVNSVRAFSSGVVRLIEDEEYRVSLGSGARDSGDQMGVERMVSAFIGGFLGGLDG